MMSAVGCRFQYSFGGGRLAFQAPRIDLARGAVKGEEWVSEECFHSELSRWERLEDFDRCLWELVAGAEQQHAARRQLVCNGAHGAHRHAVVCAVQED